MTLESNAERSRMRSLTPLAVFVIAILTVHVSGEAADPVSGGSLARPLPPNYSNGYDQYRQYPDLGVPSSPANGYKHFTGPFHAFTTWYRPRAATLTPAERCPPQPFRPRGYGNLFARQCDPYRMEYTPYTLHDGNSLYGPSYLLRQPDPRCVGCGTCEDCCRGNQSNCENCR